MKIKFLCFLILILININCKTKSENIKPDELIADFSFKLKSNGSVEFINKSKNARKYYWEFGDGETSNLTDPNHVFFLNDKYSVILTAENSQGKSFKEVILEINNTHEIISPQAYNNLYPNGTTAGGIVEYNINNLVGKTHLKEIKPFFNITKKSLFLGFWISDIFENIDGSPKTMYIFEVESKNVSPDNNSFMTLKPLFQRCSVLTFGSNNAGQKFDQLNEISGIWKIASFKQNKITGTYSGTFLSTENKKYDVKFNFDNIYIRIER